MLEAAVVCLLLIVLVLVVAKIARIISAAVAYCYLCIRLLFKCVCGGGDSPVSKGSFNVGMEGE